MLGDQEKIPFKLILVDTHGKVTLKGISDVVSYQK